MMEEDELTLAMNALRQEIEMSENEFKERISKFYNDCVNIFGRISDCERELERIPRRNRESLQDTR